MGPQGQSQGPTGPLTPVGGASQPDFATLKPVTAASATPTPTPSSANLGTSVWSGLSSAANAVGSTAKSGLQTALNGAEDLANGPTVDPRAAQEVKSGDTAGGIAAEAGEAGEGGVADLGKIVGGLGQTILSPLLALTKTIGTPIGNALGNLIPASVAQKFNDFLKANPDVGDQANKILNIANLAVPEEGGKAADAIAPAIDTAKQAITDAAGKTKDAIIGTPEEQAAQAEQMKQAVAANAKAASDKQVNDLEKEWTNPTTINKSTYNKARDVLSQSPDAPRFLGEIGANPAGHVEGGNYATEATADSLRNTVGKLSSDTIRPSLQAADYSTQKTPVSEIMSSTIADIKNSKTSTPGEMEAQLAKAQSEGEALEKQYPDGMSLTDMHDKKITYAGKGKYSPVGDPAVNNTAEVNRSFGRALGSIVEDKAPDSVPVHELNKYFQKYYRAADYLDALNGKKAPVSIGKQIARKAAAFVGAGAAEHVGGGVISAFAGYSIGKALEHALENMNESSKKAFMQNIEVTNPPAFKAVQEYLKNAGLGNPETLRLTEGSPLGSDKNPIITPAPTTYEKAAQKINMQPTDQKLLNKPGDNVITLPK